MKHEFDSNAHRVGIREAEASIPLSYGAHFPQESALLAASFLTMLIRNEIRMRRTDEQFDPDNPLDQVARQMNEATLPQDGGTVLLTTDRINAIDTATKNYFREKHIDPESPIGKDINKKRIIITSRWVAATDKEVRQQKLKELFMPEPLKPGIIGRLILKIKR